MPLSQCNPAAKKYLIGTGNPLRIVGVNALSRSRINLRQRRMNRRPALFQSHCLNPRTHHRIRRRHTGQATGQRLEIQHGAAHQQRHAATRGNILYQRQGIITKPCCRIRLGRVEHIDQVMRITLQRLRIRLGRPDIHATVHQHRIDADQLTGKLVVQVHCQVRLARGGGPHQTDQRRQR